MAGRLSQDVDLVITQPSSASVRDSQELVLAISSPSNTHVRVSQELALVLLSNTPFIAKQPNVCVIC